jgi:hypothetical protein
MDRDDPKIGRSNVDNWAFHFLRPGMRAVVAHCGMSRQKNAVALLRRVRMLAINMLPKFLDGPIQFKEHTP